MDDKNPVSTSIANKEHKDIVSCFKKAGIEAVQVPPPIDCQDGVYTANWALVVGNKAILSNLPNKRQPEEKYAEKVLRGLGKKIVKLPKEIHFSGQGDALPCGKYLFVGSHYRTSIEAHPLLARETGLEVIGLETVPQYDNSHKPIKNSITGWPDSFFYDLDLALAVITPNLIAWCPEAFLPSSQERINNIKDIDKIEVSLEEAMNGFACNLVSTGKEVIMSNKSPKLRSELEKRGHKTYTPNISELLKGGGFIRCISLSI